MQLTSLSGGERQRLKLAIQMATDGGIYLLDEPTSGLHLADVEQLLELLDRRVEAGKSVIVIELHLAVMAHAAAKQTLTGQHLAEYVGPGASAVDRGS